MKLPLLLVVAGPLFLLPTVVFAQAVPGESPGAAHPIATPSGGPVPDRVAPVPSRRVPSLTPPRHDEHPVTPGEAWPRTPSSSSPLPPALKSDEEDEITDETILDKDPPALRDSIQELQGETLGED